MLFDEEGFEKETCYKKEEFWEVLKHEIAHSYYGELTKSSCPSWLNEGICIYLSGQRITHSLEKSVKAIKYFDYSGSDVYSSGKFVKLLIEKEGKEKTFRIIGRY